VTEDFLIHYGTPRHSGRYPWGSGQQSQQSGRDFLGNVGHLKKQGLSDPEVAKAMGLKNTTELRAKMAIEKNAERQAKASQALRLKDKGMSNVAIGRQMGIPESSVRALLNPVLSQRRDILQNTAGFLKGEVDKGGYIDIGKGTESWLPGVSATRLSTAVAMLRQQGYVTINVQQPQMFGKGKTTIKVLAPPGTKYPDVVKNMDRIRLPGAWSEDGGRSIRSPDLPPASVSSKRVGIRWAEDGGKNADGVIYVRPGVKDLDMGASRYLQVRIAVDGTHYLKGMAMYKDGLPEGTDLLFNTSKSRSASKLDAMKPLTGEERPFKAVIRQKFYTDASGKKKLSPINVVNEEGDWRDWSRSISSQILSKQPLSLAKRHLDLALDNKREELDGIMKLTNPVVKNKLLREFADGADAAAVHLKAAPFRRQGTHVILPLENMRPDQIYAPGYNNGEHVALFRHPHGGTFEIPELTVNNRNPEGKKLIGTGAKDAVGIHPSVAKRLSGADFDGDAVLVVPDPRRELRITAPLKELKDFDPQEAYPKYPGMHVMSDSAKQQHMGEVSNLITDMTIKGASPEEIARAVKHSMVVIDAPKHELDFKRSYTDNGIAELKRKYQGVTITKTGAKRLSGASTLISRAGARVQVPQRTPRPAREGGPINPRTGAKIYTPTGAAYTTPKGKTVVKQEWSTRMAEVADARKLSSHTPMEEAYASHANALKAMANTARKESLRTGGIKYSHSAAKTYAPEVASLTAKLNTAYKNRPLERQAQIIAATTLRAKTRDNPDLLTDRDSLKKVKARELTSARNQMGARKKDVEVQITPKEWEAIQAGAISTNRLREILDNADSDAVKKLAMPREMTVMTSPKQALARSMLASGYTQAEVSEHLGIPVSTIMSSLYPKGVSHAR
jgi:DNA-directed RNA polymerase specialized sigma24 family protein